MTELYGIEIPRIEGDWVGCLFGEDHSEPLFETQGTFAQCVERCAEFINVRLETELWLVIERMVN